MQKDTHTGNNKLFQAITNNNLEELKSILASEQNNVNIIDSEMSTPLDAALFLGHIDMAVEILQASPNVNALNKKGLTPMHTLVKKTEYYVEQNISQDKVLSVVKSLMQKEANVAIQDRRGNTIINCIAQKAKANKEFTELYTKIGKIILMQDKHCSETIQIKNNMGKNPLDYLSRNGNVILRNAVYESLPHNKEKLARIFEEGELAIKHALEISKQEKELI